MLQALKHVKLVVNHSLVALHILLEDDLHSHLARWAVCLSNDAIGTCAKRSAESIFGSGRDSQREPVLRLSRRKYVLLVVTFRLAMQPIEHVGD